VRTRTVVGVLVASAVVVVVAQHSVALSMRRPVPGSGASSPAVGTPTATSTGAVNASPTCAQRTLSGMSLSKQVGQLFVAGVSSTSPTPEELAAIRHRHLGGVILTGHNDIGVAATRAVTRELQAQATAATTNGVKLWVSADQEGGLVQSLKGPGFSTIPTALTQGTWTRATLESRAQRWGSQLIAAGVNLDLAPVADTVPQRLGTANAPIGYYDREYGHHPKVVARHVTAFIDGLRSAGVQATAKHFPGLGRVRRNTDTSAGVTDSTTTRHDPYLLPFQRAVADHVPVVMVSLATYTRIDPGHLAAFSPVVMDMLRHDLGFSGVVISDSMTAAAVENVPAGARAVRFIRAGGTVALSVDTPTTTSMAAAVLAHAESSAHFRATVRSDALIVLKEKHRIGLLSCR
jgi:beta-N-acetylhexosaminidase